MIDCRILCSWLVSRPAPLAMVLVAVAGCGTKVPAPPTTQPVHGKVTLNGEPVTTGGFVRFVPATQGSGRFAEGAIAEDGSYSVTAFKGQAGTLPGEYKVYFAAIQSGAEGIEGPPLELPKKYLKPETTDLKVTVASGDNDINLELNGDVEEESEEAGEDMSSE